MTAMARSCTQYAELARVATPTARRIELWAFLHALRKAVWPLEVMTDCTALVNCLDRGRDYCCDCNRKAADLWGLIWRQIDANGGRRRVSVRWIKAHTRAGEVGHSVPTELAWVINEHADR